MQPDREPLRSCMGYPAERKWSLPMSLHDDRDRRIERDLQPDPSLTLSGGHASTSQIWLTAIAAFAIVVMVLYGLNQQPKPEQSASAPAPTQTTGAANDASNVPPAGEKSEPKQQQAAPPNEPAKEQQPATARP